jgi:hypothetical protein
MKCLFLIKGASFPAECAISGRSIVDVRTVCYRYKNGEVSNYNTNGVTTELDHGAPDYGSDATIHIPQRPLPQASNTKRYELTTPTKIVCKVRYCL